MYGMHVITRAIAQWTILMKPNEIKELLDRPTITPEELHASGILQCSRNKVYEAIARKVVASIKVGKKIIIPTAPR
jgi:hypothetical protein